MQKNQLKGFLMGFFATCMWGSFYPVSRMLFGESADTLDPLTVSVLRFIFAGLFLMPFLIRRGNGELVCRSFREDWKMLLFLALTGIVGEGVLVFAANKYTTAGRCTLMANASPIFTVLLAYIFLHEALTGKKVVGMLLGFLGIVLMMVMKKGNDVFGTGQHAIWGDLMALGSGMCWACYTVFGEKMSHKYGGLLTATILSFIGAVMLIPVTIIAKSNWDLRFSWKIWLGIAYIGGVTNGVGNGLWYQALKYLKPDKLGAFGYLSAFIAITISALYLKEQLSWQFLLTAAMVFAGVYLMMKNDPIPPAEKTGTQN